MNIQQLAILTREIILACKEANLDKLKELITPENVNWIFDDANHLWGTPLFLLTRLRHDGEAIPCVKFLIDIGADVNCGDGYPPLFNTTVPGVTQLLVKAGADINGKDFYGLTPLEDIYQRPDVDPNEVHYDEVDFELAKCFLDLGAHLPTDAPQWMVTFHQSRQKCKLAVITLLGIKKFRQSPIIGQNGRDVIRLISQNLWSLRFKKVIE